MITRPMVAMAFVVAVPLHAQTYPVRPVRIVTALPGASGDLIARLLSQGLTSTLGQQVIVDNRPGYLSIETVAKAPPDGYSMLVYASTMWIAPLMEKLPWDALRDFSPVTLIASTPGTVVVHPSLPVKSVRDLINVAKGRPGQLNYGSSPPGSTQHLAGELFKSLAQVDVLNVPYKSSGAAQIGLLGGEVHVMFPAAGSIAPHAKSGRVRLLAVASPQPSAFFPGVPTVMESGVPGYEFVTVTGLFAPAGTPAGLVLQLNAGVAQVLTKPDVKERLFNEGMDIVAGPPEQLATAMKSEVARFGKLIRDGGIRNP